MSTRLHPDARRAAILAVALPLAVKHGYASLSLRQVADAAGVTHPNVLHHFGTMAEFRTALMRQAIAERNLRVLAQGLAAKDKTARRAPEAMRKAALAELL